VFLFVLFPKRSIQMARGQGHVCHVSHSRMTQPHSRRGCVIFLPRCTDCSESLPTTQSRHDNQKTVWGGRKPILAVLWPAWACIWQRFAASTSWDLVESKAANNIWRSSGALAGVTRCWGTVVWREISGWLIATACLNVIYRRWYKRVIVLCDCETFVVAVCW
jgi:hypothetical protein